MQIQAWAVHEPKGTLSPFGYDAGPLGPGEVELLISHCGICHSDIHLIDNDWGFSSYPLVPGHEIVGTVAAAGSAVKHLKAGDRVGIGWQCGSCGACEYCSTGEENLCAHNQATCAGHHGGYADRVRSDARFAVKIPDALASADAAPLLCAGVTVWTPLRLYDVQPTMRTAVIGVGGLGHLAVQYLDKFGCHVTAFSTSRDKQAEAQQLGADDFLNTREPGALAAAANRFDFILATVPADLDWAAILSTLRPKGNLCLVGVPQNPIQFPGFHLIGAARRISGSNIGSPHTIAEMLEFSARHNVRARIERFPLAEVNRALDHVRANRARYRAVLDVA